MKLNKMNILLGVALVVMIGNVALGQAAGSRGSADAVLNDLLVQRAGRGGSVERHPLDIARSRMAPSSSLLVIERNAIELPIVKGRVTNPVISRVSMIAVPLPPPRRYALHDLVTIIIREQTTASSEAMLETEKESSVDGSVSGFPHLNLEDLLKEPWRASTRENFPKVGVEYDREFTGEGGYERRDSMTTRLTGQIIDIKPNGLLVVEAHTHIQNDDEIQDIKVTGTWREEDVAFDNTVLSTQGYNIRIAKEHEGELRKASKKGLFTKILDTLFAF